MHKCKGHVAGGPAPDLHAYTLHSLPGQQHAGTQGSCGYGVRGEGARLHPSLRCAAAVIRIGEHEAQRPPLREEQKERNKGRLVVIAYLLSHRQVGPQVSPGREKGLVGCRVLHLGTWVHLFPLVPQQYP